MANSKIEDYLKNIYLLQGLKNKVSISLLAEKLLISPPSVTEMIKKLSDQGLVSHVPYSGIELTEIGRRYALRIVRKHRLWEMFLFQVLHFSWYEIHAEAEELEHSMSDVMEQRIDELLGFPQMDPHGHPIPSKSGALPKLKIRTPLAALEEKQSGKVICVNDFDDSFLSYLEKMNVRLDQTIQVKEKRKFDGSMLVVIDRKEWNISSIMAENVFVEVSAQE
jgi:DtxR family Mn-dependent transcriptional regulator